MKEQLRTGNNAAAPAANPETKAVRGFFTSKAGNFWIWGAVVILIAAAVLISILAEQMEDRFGWEWDLTRNRVYSISEATKATLALLDKDVNVYTLYPTGSEDITINELLRRYEIASRHIHIENVDPISNPLFIQQFEKEGEQIEDNSLIITFAGDTENVRVISPQDLYEYELKDDQMYITALVAEQRITSSIESIMGGEQPTAYFVEGHGEKTMSSLYYLQRLLENDEYQVESYNLVYNDTSLEPEDLLFFFAPQQDITEEEAEVLTKFFRSGGKAIFLLDLFLAKEHPNFSKVIQGFGLDVGDGIVVEGDTSRYLNNQVILTPVTVDNPATDMLQESDAYAVMPRSRPVTITTISGISVSPLYFTSDSSYAKLNATTTSTEKEEGDIDGPFILAAAAEDTASGARVTVFGSSDFISTIDVARVSGNLAALMGDVSWTDDRQNAVMVSSKSMVDPPLQISNTTASILLTIFVIGLIPGLIIVFGVLVWRRRVRQ
jgi:hypothetical protein